MLPRTLQYSKVLFSIFLFLVFVQYLPIFCNDNSCPPFFQAYVVSVVRHQGNISMALGVMMFLIFLNGLLGSVLEWRGIMKFYRQVAAARSRYSTFPNKGKIRVDMDLIEDGVPLRFLLERTRVDLYGNEHGEEQFVPPPPPPQFSRKYANNPYSRQYRIKIIFSAPRAFENSFHVFFRSPFLAMRTTRNVDANKLKTRLRCTWGNKKAAQRWFDNLDAEALAELDVKMLQQINVTQNKISLIIPCIPNNMEKLDAVLRASVRLYHNLLQNQGPGAGFNLD